MRCSVFCGVSLDGFIARPDGGLDWLPQEPEEHGYTAFFESIDLLVIGRGTYETVLGFDEWAYGTKPVFVLSRNPLKPAPSGAIVERLSGDPVDLVRWLDQRGFTHAYVDGGITIQRFLRAGVINRLTITWVPVLIGKGIPLFGETGRDIPLRHLATRSYPSGLVQSDYEVVNGERRMPHSPD